MKMILSIAILLISSQSFAQSISSVDVANADGLKSVLCLMSGAPAVDIASIDDDVIVKRVTSGGAIKYEIYGKYTNNMIAACDGFILK